MLFQFCVIGKEGEPSCRYSSPLRILAVSVSLDLDTDIHQDRALKLHGSSMAIPLIQKFRILQI